MLFEGALGAAGELEQRIKELQKDEEERQHARATKLRSEPHEARAEADDPPPGVDPRECSCGSGGC